MYVTIKVYNSIIPQSTWDFYTLTEQFKQSM
jgi:hypothetical protein